LGLDAFIKSRLGLDDTLKIPLLLIHEREEFKLTQDYIFIDKDNKCKLSNYEIVKITHNMK